MIDQAQQPAVPTLESVQRRLEYRGKKRELERNSTPENNYGMRIRQIRESHRKRLTDVARFLGISVTHQSDIELGRRNPYKFEHLAKFVAFCDGDEKTLLVLEELAAARQGFVRVEADDQRTQEFLIKLNMKIEEQGGKLNEEIITEIESNVLKKLHR